MTSPPFAYRGRDPFRNDPDDTEGRRLYRARANAEAALSMWRTRKISLVDGSNEPAK